MLIDQGLIWSMELSVKYETKAGNDVFCWQRANVKRLVKGIC